MRRQLNCGYGFFSCFSHLADHKVLQRVSSPQGNFNHYWSEKLFCATYLSNYMHNVVMWTWDLLLVKFKTMRCYHIEHKEWSWEEHTSLEASPNTYDHTGKVYTFRGNSKTIPESISGIYKWLKIVFVINHLLTSRSNMQKKYYN